MQKSLRRPWLFFGLNVAFLLLYSSLYFLFTEDRVLGEFPVRLSFYVAVHSVGLLIVSISQAVIKNGILSRACLVCGLVLPFIGSGLLWVLY